MVHRSGERSTAGPIPEPRPATKTGQDDQAARGALWYLVWCHERSCKEEAKGLRDTLEKMAHDAGGRCLCVKKARAYNAWQTGEGRRIPHLLLTDWREIKPCMKTMANGDSSASPRNHPLLVAVLAEQQTTFRRVREWSRAVRTAGGDGAVDVIRCVDEFGVLLAKVLPQLGHSSWSGFCAAGQGAESSNATVDIIRSIDESHALLAKVLPQLGHSSWSGFCAAGQGAGSLSADPGKSQGSVVARSAPFIFSVGARGLPPPVVGLLSPICAWQSAVAVEKILRFAAQDQLYED